MKLISGKAHLAVVASITVAVGASLIASPASQASGQYSVVATVPVGADPWGIALSPDGTRAYVANYGSGTLSIINTSALTTSTVGVGSGPAYLALTPDGTTAYLPSNSDDSVAIVNLTTQTLMGALTGVSSAWAVAINGDDSLFVFEYSGANSPVRRFNLQTGLVDDSVRTSSYVWSATISQDGARLYAPMPGASKLAVLRTSDMTVISEFATPGQPRYAALSPNPSFVYVTSNVISGAPLVLRINTQTLTVDDSWVIGPNSYRGFGLATSPDGAKIYVALEAPSGQPGHLVVVDSATGQVDDSIAVGVNPFGVAVSPSGDRVYVTNNL